jgi:hypothetical protein
VTISRRSGRSNVRMRGAKENKNENESMKKKNK